MNLDRRRFLQLTSLGVFATVTATACERGEDRSDTSLDRPALLGMLGPEKVRQLGTHYRNATPRENTSSALRSAISSAQSHPLGISWIGGGSIDQQVRDDFAAGRTVDIDGWVLSLTEARQCALFSLVASV
ncbi:MAG TPA: hypothetical protein VGN73_00300 [Gemmatimonadaceae bacterium]|jgi:hypothetical protein|nr:hypothetical protein [Gemmatimonadaceae bacterium]